MKKSHLDGFSDINHRDYLAHDKKDLPAKVEVVALKRIIAMSSLKCIES